MVLYHTGVTRESSNVIGAQIERVRAENPEALLNGHLPDVARALGRSWEAKKRIAAGMSNPLIDRAYEVGLRVGATSGRISGAGGGGFIIFMCDPLRRPQVVEQLNACDGQCFRFHFSERGAQAWTVHNR